MLPPYGHVLLHSYRSKLGRSGGTFIPRALPQAIRILRASSFGRVTRTGMDEPKRSLASKWQKTESFDRVIAHARSTITGASDWTTRILVGNLKPHTVYWYRFIDTQGNGSRIGRTIRLRKLRMRNGCNLFRWCQSVNEGTQNAYRRMICEDQRAGPINAEVCLTSRRFRLLRGRGIPR